MGSTLETPLKEVLLGSRKIENCASLAVDNHQTVFNDAELRIYWGRILAEDSDESDSLTYVPAYIQ